MLWLTRKLQLELLFPPFKPWFKCLRLPQLMLRILSKIKLLCGIIFAGFTAWFFPGWCSPFRLSLPFVIYVAAVFVPLFLFYLFYAYVSLTPIGCFARFSSPFAHLLFIMSLCFASQTPGFCSAFFLAPFSLAHALFDI